MLSLHFTPNKHTKNQVERELHWDNVRLCFFLNSPLSIIEKEIYFFIRKNQMSIFTRATHS